ncbi:MAG: hypothetical protein H9W81_04315 [Enterococcus sp.]|nr:hypothetical protein [Enterococcus sp.]
MDRKMSKSDLYGWFDLRPIRGSSAYRMFEVFLIQNWDEDTQRTSMSRKDIIGKTGWKWAEVDNYIMFIDMNNLWEINESTESNEMIFTPKA